MAKRRLMIAALLFLASSTLATGSMAGLDPDTDSMGIYFDTGGNNNCVAMNAFTPFPAYLLLMNPAESINGFACSLNLVSAIEPWILSSELGSGWTDDDESLSGYRVTGPGYPLAGAVLLCTLSLLVQVPWPLDFYIGPHPDPSLQDWPVILRNGQWVRCGVSSGDVRLPVASVNGSCWVAVEGSTFGAVKSLYR